MEIIIVNCVLIFLITLIVDWIVVDWILDNHELHLENQKYTHLVFRDPLSEKFMQLENEQPDFICWYCNNKGCEKCDWDIAITYFKSNT